MENLESVKIKCPFWECFAGEINLENCVYMDTHTYCEDLICCPGNGDAWCNEMIVSGLSLKE